MPIYSEIFILSPVWQREELPKSTWKTVLEYLYLCKNILSFLICLCQRQTKIQEQSNNTK